MTETAVLALNSGSSSLKFALFAPRESALLRLCSGSAEEIGSGGSRLAILGPAGEPLAREPRPIASHEDAFRFLVENLQKLSLPVPAAIGHRVVHGGPVVVEHQKITPQVMRHLKDAAPFAPLHIPVALRLIRAAQHLYPAVPQFACLDTAFHRTLPEAAARFPLPRKFWEAGIRRYGFHGLACESVLHALAAAWPARAVIAHLGNGASITAVRDRRSIDTTMGLTPTGGIVMGTRPGDLDPGVLLYLLRTLDAGADELEQILDKQSGLLGISGISSDMRQLHASAEPDARLAVEIFCRAARKALGAYAALLGGLDLLVFSGGIGQHDALVRSEICSGLESFGLVLDPAANRVNLDTISASSSRTRVCIVSVDEEAQIARHVLRLM